MNKDRVVIEEGGMRYELSHDSMRCVLLVDGISCNGCKDASREVFCVCKNSQDNMVPPLRCISATKIEPSPKMYFSWNREEARHLVGKMVDHHGGGVTDKWERNKLVSIEKGGVPFDTTGRYACIIREIPTIKLTRAELNEKYGVPDNVVIVD